MIINTNTKILATLNTSHLLLLTNKLLLFFFHLNEEKAMAVLPSKVHDLEDERDGSQSPVEPLPIYQQRDNYFS